MIRSIAFVISFKSMFSLSYLKFSIVTLLILRTKLLIYCARLKGTALIDFFSKQIIERCSNFSSFRRHYTVISSPRFLWASTTFHIITITVASLTYFLSSAIRILLKKRHRRKIKIKQKYANFYFIF